MALRPENLPRDPALLSELALALDAENEGLRATITTLKGLIFGARSERLATIGAKQLALDLSDEAGAAPSSAAANDDEKAAPGKTRRAPKRNIGALSKLCRAASK
jgi:transposase